MHQYLYNIYNGIFVWFRRSPSLAALSHHWPASSPSHTSHASSSTSSVIPGHIGQIHNPTALRIVRDRGQCLLGLLQFFLFGCFLCIKEGSGSSFVNSEFVSINESAFLGSQMKSSVHTDGISKLDKGKDIVADAVGIFSSPSNSCINNNTCLVGNLKESLQTMEVDILDRVDPNCALHLLTVQIFKFLQHIDRDGWFFELPYLFKVVQGHIINLIIFQKDFLNPVFVARQLIVHVSRTIVRDEVETNTQNL